MKFISNNDITDPTLNLAMEEYVLKNMPKDDSYFLFYVNRPSIIIGKNQNTIEEVNQPYIDEHGIDVVRRISGGGAVYHDTGNLNFSFVTDDDGNSFHNFKKFTEPIVEALQSLGVDADMSGRNDIQVGSAKISGNAMVKVKDRMFSHGTLMLNSELNEVQNALKVNPAKIKSKGIKSVRSRVANISEFLDEPLDIDRFKEIILKTIFGEATQVEEYILTDDDWKKIEQLSNEKYRTWEWNYGRNPKYNFEREEKFEKGFVQIKLDVKKGRIEHAKIFGDFFGEGDITELENALEGTMHEFDSIEEALSNYDIYHYFGDIERYELIRLMS
ncbi:lipoate--protein ligase [Staphylococcus saprophyticus]|jgi:lipoate-protein ligase A|uniref:lipoate--protein ligase n=2 Tax=Staphylococcus saprophyticus TaxID=29385 RepID=Q49WF7_STAS1|nr:MULTISPECIES: lipoate--protein ligase [Staphylococcus]CRV23823.1 lipoate-protein ligase [Streptococcus equi subsp. equi]SIN58799.1 Lipoate-protein ligase LplJ [Mycobacteroides abscessus subsp. abscessus]AMG20840.1 lipoate--protein ligase [Staphylococcus saprophyticus]AMG33910.1 lipoate--protein ligase [Staphylococcus saprophyticus]ASE59754.1 lipoate--protein ligase [Staphylococcus saprophyticus]